MSEKLLPYRCLSSDCLNSMAAIQLMYFSPRELPGTPCPHCHRTGNIYPAQLVHLITQDQALGVIYGSSQFGNSDRRYMFLCGQSQRNFYQPHNSPLRPKFFTLEASAATCYNCLVSFGANLDNQSRRLIIPSHKDNNAHLRSWPV